MGGFRGYVNPGQDDEAACDGDGREVFVEEQPWSEHRNERHEVNEIIDRDRADFPNDFARLTYNIIIMIMLTIGININKNIQPFIPATSNNVYIL